MTLHCNRCGERSILRRKRKTDPCLCGKGETARHLHVFCECGNQWVERDRR